MVMFIITVIVCSCLWFGGYFIGHAKGWNDCLDKTMEIIKESEND